MELGGEKKRRRRRRDYIDEKGEEEEGKVAKKADDGAGRDSAEEKQQQAHLRQTNKPDPAGSLLSTTPFTPLGFIKPTQDISIPNVKGRG